MRMTCEAVSRQYSAVLRTKQAVCNSKTFGRPSPERRSYLISAPPSTSSAYTLSHFRYTRQRSNSGCRVDSFAHRSRASR